jgi:filamentous hemagglutinin
VSRLAEIGSTTSNARVAAVSAVAGGLAIKNGVDAAKDVAGAIKSGTGSLGVTVSASLGSSKSKSTSESTDQTIVASSVSGRDVNIIATGAGSAGTIKVIGSDVAATNNLTVLGSGGVTFQSATETDTNSGKSSSFGVSLGVSASVGLDKGKLNTGVPSVNFGVSGSKSSFAGTDVTNREATLSAGGTATVGTPGALTLDGAILSAKRVEIDAGSLAIASRQDTSTFASKDKSAGVNVSVTFAGQVSASGNLSSGKQSGDFASVQEQAGIRAGEDGFGIRVAGNTDLKGAVIASTADAARNSLTTGTLTATDIANRETFKASSTSIGAGIGANLGKDRKGTINTDSSGQPLSGIKTGIGTLSATPPTALSASGSQSSTTVSAIATGGITVTTGDTASLGVAQTISRDTSGANDALTKQFDEAKRNEIAQGFEATRQLVSEVGTFFANRGREEADLTKQADDAKARGDTAEETRLRGLAADSNRTYGATSPTRLIATALTGAASSNVTGSLGSLVQGAAVNVLQGLGVEGVKFIADSFATRTRNADGTTTLTVTPQSESIRAALQAVVACGGSAAGGSNGCGSAAAGAAASVAFNNLLTLAGQPTTTVGGQPLTLEESQARTNIVASLVAAIAQGAGLDASVATTAAIIETEDNGNNRNRVSAFFRILFQPIALNRTSDNVVERNFIYGNLNDAVNSLGSVYKTNFFNAASEVTGIFGLSGAQSVATATGNIYDETTLGHIRTLGANLYRDVNVPLFNALYYGNDSFTLANGSTVGSITNNGVRNVDYALVHNEQSYVQRFIEALPPTDRANFIRQSTEALQLARLPASAGNIVSPASVAIVAVLDRYGSSFSFGNQTHREAIGTALVNLTNPQNPTRGK